MAPTGMCSPAVDIPMSANVQQVREQTWLSGMDAIGHCAVWRISQMCSKNQVQDGSKMELSCLVLSYLKVSILTAVYFTCLPSVPNPTYFVASTRRKALCEPAQRFPCPSVLFLGFRGRAILHLEPRGPHRLGTETSISMGLRPEK